MPTDPSTAPTIVPPAATPGTGSFPAWLDHLARIGLLRFLAHLRQGRLTLVEGDYLREFGEDTKLQPQAARIEVRHPRFYRAVLFGGSRGLGVAYIRGDWSSPDLTAVICLLARNVQALERYFSPDRLAGPFHRLGWFSCRNTPAGSQKNIAAHYDLGNDFYALFLDETMAYSCGIFERADSSLTEAQIAKYDRICRKLDLQPSDHLLEIGTGWGGFALHAAQHYGCRVTTTTISRAQYEFTRHLIQQAGLSGQVTLLLEDYRDLRGQFDKLASIEMIEAVGYEFLDDFYRVCSRRLKADGLMLLQAIIIGDQVFDRHRRSVDFICSQIFPGGCLVSIQAMGNAAARVTDLRLVHLEDLTPHYCRTLCLWRERFFDQLEQVRTLGYPEEFIRLWEFYLCYCEGGFTERYIGDVQLLYAKPRCRHPVWPSMK
jgi:cyclopropane-fatty-acyl-phospholipid synthase